MERVEEPREARAGSIHRKRVLREVVRADRKEVAVSRELYCLQSGGRSLNENPELVSGVEGNALAPQTLLFFL